MCKIFVFAETRTEKDTCKRIFPELWGVKSQRDDTGQAMHADRD